MAEHRNSQTPQLCKPLPCNKSMSFSLYISVSVSVSVFVSVSVSYLSISGRPITGDLVPTYMIALTTPFSVKNREFGLFTFLSPKSSTNKSSVNICLNEISFTIQCLSSDFSQSRPETRLGHRSLFYLGCDSRRQTEGVEKVRQ